MGKFGISSTVGFTLPRQTLQCSGLELDGSFPGRDYIGLHYLDPSRGGQERLLPGALEKGVI